MNASAISPDAMLEDRLQDRHFKEIARLVESYSGITLAPVKRLMIEGRLRRRVRALGLDNLSDYGVEIFERGRFDEEFDHVINCVTTNKTDFFREPDHFAYLVNHGLPTLRRLHSGGAGRLKFWSAAASNGAEAYTLAMLLAEPLGLDGDTFEILATDLNREVLDHGRRAIYPLAFAAPVPQALRARYLMASRDPHRKEVRVVPELRSRVCFDQLNLMDAAYPFDTDFDAIFCRNVLIYFSKPNQHAVIERLTSHLRPGGYLFLGHCESLAGNEHPNLRHADSTIFRRVD